MCNNYKIRIISSDNEKFIANFKYYENIKSEEELFFAYMTLELIDMDIDKIMFSLDIALAKEYEIAKSNKTLENACDLVSNDLKTDAIRLTELKSYKKNLFVNRFNCIAFISSLQVYNSDVSEGIIFVLKYLDKILYSMCGAKIRFLTISEDKINCCFDLDFLDIYKKSMVSKTKYSNFFVKVYIPNPNVKCESEDYNKTLNVKLY